MNNMIDLYEELRDITIPSHLATIKERNLDQDWFA